jgi:Na+-translocating ferredoxin:NAD+ oxidoreductase subunit B
MDTVYERLATRLDAFPQGFPRTESGVELRILEKIFTPDEAALALQLSLIPETAKAAAHRLGRSTEALRPVLDSMVGRGQILSSRRHGEKVYGLAPFVVGIYEFQLARLDEALARLVEEYAPHLARAVGGVKPALARVVPINARIDSTAAILPYEDVRTMLAGARSFRLMACICRSEQAKLGTPCSHPLETCLAFSAEESAYDGTLPEGFGRPITREEAQAVLDLAEREGLVHCTYNVRRESMFVCNCCACCCGFLRGVKEFGAPHLLIRSNWVSAIAADRCTGCGACAAGRCPMDAIRDRDGRYAVSEERCIGCGVCSVGCPADAVALTPRPRAERATPPRTITTWALSRAVRRHGPLRTALQLGEIALQAAWPRRSRDERERE